VSRAEDPYNDDIKIWIDGMQYADGRGDCSSRGPPHLGCGGHASLGAVAQEQVGARERGRDCSGAVLRLPQPEASDDSHGRTRPTGRPL